jgi:hypothetical protein
MVAAHQPRIAIAQSPASVRIRFEELLPCRAGDDRRTGLTVASPTSFGEDDRGWSARRGAAYRLVPR